MKRKNKHNVVYMCPCCNQVKGLSEISLVIDKLDSMKQDNIISYYGNVGNDLLAQLPIDEFEWACNECYGRKKALPTVPENQKYVDYRPYLAYYDTLRQCENCGVEYVFKKEEKRFWYEVLQFWVQSKPKNCISCRKKIRKRKRSSDELSFLLADGEENLDKNKLELIIEKYKNLGLVDKMKYYQAMKKKL